MVDVGHGNTSVIHDGALCLVVDAPLGPTIVETLRSEGVDRVRLAIASHSDADHLGGLIALLLSDIAVDEVRCNPDAQRRSAFWYDFLVAAKRARATHGTRIRTELTTETTPDLVFGDVRIEVLHPPGDLALSGTGGEAADGRILDSNTLSAVLRVLADGHPLALLTGDLDVAGLEDLTSSGADLTAPVLVFPHHGGLAGTRSEERLREFAETLAAKVAPETIVFSFSRGKHRNPLPAIIEGVRRGAPRASIACTQLSKRCSDDQLLPTLDHLSARFSLGHARGTCCAGTLVFGPASFRHPDHDSHQAAIAHLRERLCR